MKNNLYLVLYILSVWMHRTFTTLDFSLLQVVDLSVVHRDHKLEWILQMIWNKITRYLPITKQEILDG